MQESRNYYNRARYYDPSTGRFLTPDPIGFLGGDLNLYGYVFQSPINYNDPDGLVVNDPSPHYPTQQQTAEKRMCEDRPLENIYPEILLGAAAFRASGRTVWARIYPSGGAGVGMNRSLGNGQSENIIRIDFHKFNNGPAKPHVDIPGVIKHWPWNK